jgi:hypothetical protein
MRWLGPLLLVALVTAGCAMVTLIEPKPTTIGDAYTVQPQIRWASVPARPGMDLWTVDGSALDALTFVKGLADGEVLVRGAIREGPPEERRPRFRAQMTPSDVVELVVDSYALLGNQKIEAVNLRPAKFGAADGFRFELTWVSPGGLEIQALVAGAVVKGRLHLIIYAGTRAHYFPKYRDDAERVIASVRLL